MSDNGERATVRRAAREARVQRRDELAGLAKFMADPPGRRYIYNTLAACHTYSTSFATNALAMAFREGERNVGLRLVNDLIEACPDLYFQMLKEAGNERSRTDTDGTGDSGDTDATGYV